MQLRRWVGWLGGGLILFGLLACQSPSGTEDAKTPPPPPGAVSRPLY